jgi:hypothetical protein
MKLAIILCEFGKPEPDVSQYRKCWPEAYIYVYGDKFLSFLLLPGFGHDHKRSIPADYDVRDVPELGIDHPRYGWRMQDYWTVRKAVDALNYSADVAICFDADMRILNFGEMRHLPDLADTFGACLPVNPRHTVARDCADGADVDFRERDSCGAFGTVQSYNCSPVALGVKGIPMAEMYCTEMLARPVRGPLAWARAMWLTGIAPLTLPAQWCVCEADIGIADPICLHIGHESVRRYYAGMEAK